MIPIESKLVNIDCMRRRLLHAHDTKSATFAYHHLITREKGAELQHLVELRRVGPLLHSGNKSKIELNMTI